MKIERKRHPMFNRGWDEIDPNDMSDMLDKASQLAGEIYRTLRYSLPQDAIVLEDIEDLFKILRVASMASTKAR